MPLAELPNRLVRMNLHPSPNADRLKEQNYFISAAATSERYKDARERAMSTKSGPPSLPSQSG